MKILYGTTNKGKLQAMINGLKGLDIELVSLNDMEGELPVVNENGKTPLENAEIKARAYYEEFHMPVFSCDSGLYFDELEEELQPGIHTRRVNGKELTDEEMIGYYSNLAKENGGKLCGKYKNAIWFIINEGIHFCSMDESLATEPFLLVEKAHEKLVKGFPLDSLSIDIATGKYYYDMEEKSVDQSAIEMGFKEFFSKAFLELDLNN
jgi:8-oxo-dGTP diphosphatase